MITRGPWKVKERELKYQNPWITVHEDKVILPNGKDGIHVFIEVKPGVSILPVDDEGYVYLTKEYHYAAGKETIEVVAGGIDAEESALEAAQRELQEELGITAQEWIDLGEMDQLTTYTNARTQSFLARGLKFGATHLEGSESVTNIKVKLTEAVEMVMEGRITNGVSSALILKGASFLQNSSSQQKY